MHASDFIDLDAGTLNREIFSSEDIFRREVERVLTPAWSFVGHTSQLARNGDFFISRCGTEPVIVARDAHGEIRVLLNSCRHRGMPVCRYDKGNAADFICSYHGWSYGLDGALTGVPKLKERYQGKLDRDKWGLIQARVCVYYGSIWATFDEAAPSFEDYLGADMQFYLRSLLQGPDGEDDGYEVIGGIVKWQVPCNWKFGAENFAGDHYHGYSHISVERLSVGLSGTKSRHNFAGAKTPSQAMFLADPKRGHTIRASVYQVLPGYDEQAVPDEVNDYYRACHEKRQKRLGDQSRLLIRGGVIFPNTHFNSAGRTMIGVWLPLSASRTEVWRWLFVPRNAPSAVKDTLREYYLRYAGPAGLVEQDDMENWTAAQRGTQGIVSRKYPFNYQLAMGLARPARPDEWLGKDVSITEDVTEHNQLAFYAHWARLMSDAR
jgi:phenylpropionate dioxygenase-like ring-hydroxylating dioxygenase large terminal subunit